MERQFGVGQAEGLLGDGKGHAGELEEDHAGFDLGDVVLDRAFALALADFGGLLGDGLVRRNPSSIRVMDRGRWPR